MTWTRFFQSVPPSLVLISAVVAMIALGWALLLAAAVQGGSITIDAGVVQLKAHLEQEEGDEQIK